MTTQTERLTMAQALVRFLKNQYVERDGAENRFFAGCFGIFGHGIVAGVGQALMENPDFRYYQVRNEQSSVHAASAYAKVKNRLQTFACLSSIGPGATNMITGAATATINRLPVLLIPGDIFARRNVAPVLQQVESAGSQDFSANDCFRPVSKYWDRINRPDQLLTAPARGAAGAHQPGRDRRGDPGAAAGCADRGLRLPGCVLPQARLAYHAQPAGSGRAGAGGRADPGQQEADDRGRRRRDLFGGD